MQPGQTVTYNNKQYKIKQVYNSVPNDPELQKTLPTDPTQYPVYILEPIDNSGNIITVTKQNQVQFGG